MAQDPQRIIVEKVDEVAKDQPAEVIDDPTVVVKSAALGAITLAELAKLVPARSQDEKIRSLATHVQSNQQTLRTTLATIAARKRLDVPGTMVYDDEQRLKDIAAKSGPQFDVAYVRQTIVELGKSRALFESALTMTDKDLAAFAQQMLVLIDADLEVALKLLPV